MKNNYHRTVGLLAILIAASGGFFTYVLRSAAHALAQESTVQIAATQNVTACGCLSSANTTYVLQNDVTSNGTCFVVTGANSVLDLNGKTVTYGNSAPITVPNGDFENATSGNWNLVTAPNATRAAGSFVQPVSVYSGSNAIKFTLPAAEQSFRNAQTVTLEPNTTYTLSAMLYNVVNASAVFSLELEGTSTKATYTGRTWRGFQYISTNFTTSSSAPTYNLIVRLTNANSGSGSIFVDDIRILRARNMGVALGVSSSSGHKPSDISCYGTPDNLTVRNGTIRQGQANGNASDAVYINSNNVEVANLNLTTQGPNSKVIHSPFSKRPLNVHDNIITSNVRVISVRDNFDGAAVYVSGTGGSTFANNTITNSSQIGFALVGNGGGLANTVRNNNITVRSFYTNDFGIQLWGDRNGLIHNNTINCTGSDLSCRGIFAGGNSLGTKIYNNTVSVQAQQRNQEYNGCASGGGYGLQIEYANNVEAYGNTVTATAAICDAAAFRANPVSDSGVRGIGHYVHDNNFTARKTGNGVANGMLMGALTGIESLRFERNVVTTDQNWMNIDGGSSDLVFTGNTFGIGPSQVNPFRPLYTFDYNPPNNAAVNFNFVDNAYPTTASRTAFETASFTCVSNNHPCAVGGGGWADRYSDFSYSWTTNIIVRDGNVPVAGANVIAVDRTGSIVANETTGTDGRAQLVLAEWTNVASTKTQKNPYVISAALGNASVAGSFTADHTQTLTLNLTGASEQDLTAPNRISNLLAQ